MTEHSSAPREENMSFTHEEDIVRYTLAGLTDSLTWGSYDAFEEKVASLSLKSDKWLVFLDRCRIMRQRGARWSLTYHAWVTEEGSSVDLQDTCVTLDGKRVKYKISQKTAQERARGADLRARALRVLGAWFLMLFPGVIAFSMIEDSIGLILPEWSVAALALLTFFGPLVYSAILGLKAVYWLSSDGTL